MDTLQQMVSDILNKAQVERDEGPEALPRILIVTEGPCQICYFYISIFFVVILAQTNLKAHVYFYFFVQIHYMYWFRFQ